MSKKTISDKLRTDWKLNDPKTAHQLAEAFGCGAEKARYYMKPYIKTHIKKIHTGPCTPVIYIKFKELPKEEKEKKAPPPKVVDEIIFPAWLSLVVLEPKVWAPRTVDNGIFGYRPDQDNERWEEAA